MFSPPTVSTTYPLAFVVDVVMIVGVGDEVDFRVRTVIDVSVVKDVVFGLGKADVVLTVGVDGTSVDEGVEDCVDDVGVKALVVCAGVEDGVDDVGVESFVVDGDVEDVAVIDVYAEDGVDDFGLKVLVVYVSAFDVVDDFEKLTSASGKRLFKNLVVEVL